MTPDDLARACAEAMWACDQASAGLGIAIERIAPGRAHLSMTVEPRMLNGHGACHGGFIFSLADSAFAFACNSDGLASVASHCSISFLRPARQGDRLLAVAHERCREGRTGIYDVRVTAGDAIIAEFCGHSRTTGQRWFAEPAPSTPPPP